MTPHQQHHLVESDGKIFIEIIPSILSFVATKIAWNAMSDEGKQACIDEVYAQYQMVRDKER